MPIRVRALRKNPSPTVTGKPSQPREELNLPQVKPLAH